MSLLSQVHHGKRPAPRRCMIHGVQGVGKSNWAAASDHPVFVQTEDGLGEIDCAKFPLSRTYGEVMAALAELRTAQHDFKTVVVDSLDWLERLIWQEVCTAENVSNIEKIGFQKGYTFALNQWRKFLDALDDLRRERGMAISGTESVGVAGVGTFTQTGGSHSAGALSIGLGSAYSLSGGTLSFTGGLADGGAFTISGTATLNVGGVVDLSAATLLDVSQVTVTGQPNALIILPAGSSTADFLSYSNPSGLTATGAAPITIPAGTTLATSVGLISVPVICAGTLTGAVSFEAGINVQGVGNVAVATLVVDNNSSGLSGGQLTIGSGNEYIGYAGTGSFTQSGGTHSLASTLNLGYGAGSVGVYALSSGLLVASYESVGYAGAGTFAQSGGTQTAVGQLALGVYAGSVGNYSLSSGLLLVRGNEYIGYAGIGSFVQSGGTHSVTAANDLYVGYSLGSAGSYVLTGGQLITYYEYVGESGAGTFVQSGGTNSVFALMVGENSAVVGNYSLSDGLLTAGSVWIGDGGPGNFVQSGGTHSVSGSASLGNGARATGSYSLSSGLLTVSGDERIGVSGSATVMQSGGTHSVGGALNLGYGGGGVGNYVLSGGGLTVQGTENIGVAGGGSFIQTGGTNTTSEVDIAATGAYSLLGGTLSCTNSLGGLGAFTLGGTASLSVGGLLNLNRATILGLSQVSIVGQVNSLIILPAGSSTASFLSYSNLNGLTAVGGTLVTIPAGYSVTGGVGEIDDLVVCGGTLTGTPSLYGGVSMQSAGSVTAGTLRADSVFSGMSGGQINVETGSEYIGYAKVGSFTQAGGTNAAGNLYVGYSLGSFGTYALSNGSLVVQNGEGNGEEYIGYNGNGRVIQTGGANSANCTWAITREVRATTRSGAGRWAAMASAKRSDIRGSAASSSPAGATKACCCSAGRPGAPGSTC